MTSNRGSVNRKLMFKLPEQMNAADVQKRSDQRKSVFILGMIALVEGAWVLWNVRVNPAGFFRFSGMLPFAGTLSGWMLACVVAVFFVVRSARLPSVRANLFRLSSLKVLAVILAISAGFCEELIFRKVLMDALAKRGIPGIVQIVASALAFGLAHAIWAFFKGSVRAGVGAVVATGSLGGALATVYILSGRSVAPCIVSHFLINLFVEPGLVLAAVRGEMGASKPT